VWDSTWWPNSGEQSRLRFAPGILTVGGRHRYTLQRRRRQQLAAADDVADNDKCRSDELRRRDHLRKLRQSRRDDPLIGTRTVRDRGRRGLGRAATGDQSVANAR
jgi:hypothetical protein